LPKPYDQILTIDFETRWDSKSYTLSKMTTEEYIRDDRFTCFGVCTHLYGSDEPIRWVRRSDLSEYFSGIDWGRTAVLAHNAQFDVSILEWVYGAHPCFIFDTLSMARALRGVEVGNSLAKLAADFQLPEKGKAVHSTDGLTELDEDVESELAAYCQHDVYLCERIFERLAINYPTKELRLIDMTLKMYTRPVLELDKNMLLDAIEEEREHREGLLTKLGLKEEVLASNQQFASALRSLGVIPPTKKSKTTGKMTLALAKNDALFQALLKSDNEDVAALCEARLKVKSTTERTRAQRFYDIATRGSLPVPLSYYGAATGRWTASKGSAINMQNLKRGSFLRKAIMAPKGYQLAVGDLSQIEPRVLAWLSEYEELLAIFRAKGDPYAQFGAQMFGIPGMTKDSHPVERQSAKSALLGAGYGLGWASFAQQLLVGFLGAPPLRYSKDDAKKLGVTMDSIRSFIENDDYVARMREIPHTCTEQELLIHCVAAKAIIDKYRAAAWPVKSFWALMEELLVRCLAGGEEIVYKCLTFRKEEIVLPSGMSILYPNLRQEKDEKGAKRWVYGPEATPLYGGKITNNVVQGTARVVMTDGMLRVSKRYFVAGTVHDEQIAVVPDSEAQEAFKWMIAQMTREPSYMPEIPLAADGGVHRRYGLAKN
jgi:DNA polymerase I-like protein with 3'-5' exonuclease and polymerase domains